MLVLAVDDDDIALELMANALVHRGPRGAHGLQWPRGACPCRTRRLPAGNFRLGHARHDRGGTVPRSAGGSAMLVIFTSCCSPPATRRPK